MKPTKDYYQNVFINCPFDDPYNHIFNAIVFTVHDIGFRPRCALEISNAGQNRLDKIFNLINECKYGIHDISRTELDIVTKLPRFNMPLELGLDLGCKRFGEIIYSEKVILILDTEPYRYREFISDISGQDVFAHRNDDSEVINVIRNWLRLEIDPKTTLIPSGDEIYQRYIAFKKSLPILCETLHWNKKSLNFADFSFVVATWIDQNHI